MLGCSTYSINRILLFADIQAYRYIPLCTVFDRIKEAHGLIKASSITGKCGQRTNLSVLLR